MDGTVRAASTVVTDPRRAVIFGSLEAGPTSTFTSAGFKLAPGGPLDASGFRVMGSLGTGVDHRPAAGKRNVTLTPEVTGLAGYEWKVGPTYIALSGGVHADARMGMQRLALTRPMRAGPRFQVDIWSNPTPVSMLQMAAHAGGPRGQGWLRAAAGWTVREAGYVGPEIELYREQRYRKRRLGLHLTGLKVLGGEARLSGGWQVAGRTERGIYGAFALQWRR